MRYRYRWWNLVHCNVNWHWQHVEYSNTDSGVSLSKVLCSWHWEKHTAEHTAWHAGKWDPTHWGWSTCHWQGCVQHYQIQACCSSTSATAMLPLQLPFHHRTSSTGSLDAKYELPVTRCPGGNCILCGVLKMWKAVLAPWDVGSC